MIFVIRAEFCRKCNKILWKYVLEYIRVLLKVNAISRDRLFAPIYQYIYIYIYLVISIHLNDVKSFLLV